MAWFTAQRPPPRASHPFYPPDVEIPGYSANVASLSALLGAFGSIVAIVVTASVAIARRTNPRLDATDLCMVGWFVLCGSLHCFFEGYFVLNHAQLAGSQAFLAQVWKEYALSDSRYLTSDPFTLCVEAVTAFVWGPLCYAAAVCIARGSSLRYPLQIVVCCAHLYGVALYYGTCYADYVYRGVSYSRPEPLYFWGYYVGMNSPWAVVPALIMCSSFKKIRRMFGIAEDIVRTLKASGFVYTPQEPKKTR